jgi:hypothetical protein
MSDYIDARRWSHGFEDVLSAFSSELQPVVVPRCRTTKLLHRPSILLNYPGV